MTSPIQQAATENPAEEAGLIAQLVQRSRHFDETARDLERNCWMAVHQHIHGVLPSEYDIREVPEDLYLKVLASRRLQDQGEE